MNLPRQVPLVYGAAFTLWGWCGGELMLGILAGLALEAPGLLGRRVAVDGRAYRMAWLLALLLFWLIAVNGWLTLSRLEAMRSLLKWMPMAMFPVAMASAMAKQPGVPVSALLLLLRNRYLRPSMGGVVPTVPRLDPFLPCFWGLLISTSHLNAGRWFYFSAAALVALAVLGQKGLKHQRLRATACLAVVIFAGSILGSGIRVLHRMAESMIYGRMRGPSGEELNRNVTHIGWSEEIKQVKDILFRVRHESGEIPTYLCEATFDQFNPMDVTWLNSDRLARQFENVPPVERNTTSENWEFGTQGEPTGRIRIRTKADFESTVLPLPMGASRIEKLPVSRMARNGLGVVRVEAEKPVLDFEVISSTAMPLRPLPDVSRDLALGPRIGNVISPTVDKLGLRGLPPAKAVDRVKGYFSNGFAYTRDVKKASLKEFLETRHAGHCEYYATATVLLLRSAGVPARYHTGFILAEFDAPTRSWKVRGSHAHAWATAWVNGRWEVVDNTPPDWINQDGGGVSVWRKLLDWCDAVWLDFQEWRDDQGTNAFLAWFVPVTMVLAVVYTVLRFVLGRRKHRKVCLNEVKVMEYPAWTGTSRWLMLLPMVESHAGLRPSSLTSRDWIRSIPGWPENVRQAAQILVDEHNRRRFGAGEADAGGDAEAGKAEQALRGFLEGGHPRTPST